MRKNASRIVLIPGAFVLLLGACGGPEEAPVVSEEPATAPTPVAAGSILGMATYADGDPDTAIKMDADPVCAGLHAEAVHTEKVVAEGGHLANVFVYVKEGVTGSYSAPSEAHVLDQRGCQYFPHVSGLMVGQTLLIRNSDPTLHNVHALPKVNDEFNQGQPFIDMEFEKTFDQSEVMVRFKCDVHPWMSSYMGVLEHRFFGVSGSDGSFSIEGLPAGDYVVEAWHEEFGTQTQNVTVEADGTVEVNFDFSPTAG